MAKDKNENIVRVLHMIGSLEIGGAQTMIANLYNYIDKTKIQFDFIIDHDTLDTPIANSFRKMGVKIYVMPTFRGTNILEVKKAWKNFFREHSEYRILHSHVRSYASLYLPIAKRYGLKTIIHSHSTSNGSGFVAMIKRAFQYPLRYQADYYLGCSKEAGEWLFGRKIVNSPKYYILKNGIDVQKYKFNQEVRKQYRNKLMLENEITYIHVGRFHQSKNHIFLLNIFAEIHKKEPNSILLLIGDGELKRDIENRINDLRLNDAVKLLGSRDDVHMILQASDCFLFPSEWEGLGIAVIEAQASGLKCICSENVPKMVAVTQECCFLPMERDCWVNEALDLPRIRNNNIEKIISAGFGINNSADELCRIYQNVILIN